MKKLSTILTVSAILILSSCSPSGEHRQPTVAADPLPSWNEGATKQSIMDFVTRVTDPASPGFVPEAERIATFDNDGTLWAEQPLYFQLFFAIDRVKALAPEHPEWETQQPFKAVIEDDLEALVASGKRGLLELIMATHAGMTTDEFARIATIWLETTVHPTSGRPFTDMVYQPMLEVLDYLCAHGFKTYIVSAGGIEFMRPWTEEVYGIPPEQVVGSSIKTSFEIRDNGSVLMRLPEIDFIDDKTAKPVAINSHIGRRPIAAFGNSDGDLQMLQYATGGDNPGFALLVHHDDAEREWAYDRESHIGRLDKGLDEADARGWTVVSMQDDWRMIFPLAD